MEETVRSLLQYKSKFEQLKQDRHSAANSYENQILQFQNAITKLKIENETLKKQINTLEATGISQVQKALVERLRILEHEKSRIEREGEQQRKQYERCLDDVAKQVVKAVLSQKGLREEISSLQHRVKELETGNCALSALLVQRLGQKINYSPTSATTMPVAESRSVMFDIHRSSSVKMAIERPASCDLTKGLRKLKNDGWQAAISYHRPQSLNLEICCSHNAEESTKCDRVLGDETPESGNRDEGYSTMSSDVQGTTEQPSTKGLEDVKEANENESNALIESSPCSRVTNSEDTDVIFVPLSLSFSFINPRHSYPPLRCLSTAAPPPPPSSSSSTSSVHQCIMRSYSDSHLFLKLATAAAGCHHHHPSHHYHQHQHYQHHHYQHHHYQHYHHHLNHHQQQLLPDDEDRTSWYSGGELWDMDYVQHWLRLDETRTAIQQRMEYDASELEDWSMDEATGADGGWKRTAVAAVAAAVASADGCCGGVGGKQQSLPCIEEDDSAAAMDDALQAAVRDMSWHHFRAARRHICDGSGSPAGDSWSSADEYTAADTPPSKRSSVSCSADSIEMLPPPGPIAGTDFTRDFYRLVKFESSKSLASTSSRRSVCCEHGGSDAAAQPDREQALQTVLDFIAEQQQYCLSRQAADRTEPVSPATVGCDPAPVADGGGVSEQPFSPSDHRCRDSNSCSDSNLLNSKDSGLCGSDVEIECLPEDGATAPQRTITVCLASPSPPPLPALSLGTVPEEDEDGSAKSTSPQPSSVGRGVDSSSACTVETVMAAWTGASSKDFIDHLNRMTADGFAAAASAATSCVSPNAAAAATDVVSPHDHAAVDLDEACCCPTGWVHVERDIDFADPKERANLLDVMLASSRSSSSSTSTGDDDDDDVESYSSGVSDGEGRCRVSVSDTDGAVAGVNDTEDDSSDEERNAHDEGPRPGTVTGDAEESYNRLHKLHRVRRQKKASAIRDGFGVLRGGPAALRQSIVGRSDFFVRFGDKEREAMSNFDFLDDLSTTSLSTDSGERASSPVAATADKCYSYSCSSSSPRRPDLRRPEQRGGARLLPADTRRQRRRRWSGLSLSDSCGDSD